MDLRGIFCKRCYLVPFFFSLHFMLPFVIILLIIFHLLFLHSLGSSHSISTSSNLDKISFGPYYIYKDLLGILILLFFLCWFSFNLSYSLGDSENFNPANPLSTPIHIQPEWYFLFAYAILRSVPSKLGGVVALLIRISIFFFSFFYYL